MLKHSHIDSKAHQFPDYTYPHPKPTDFSMTIKKHFIIAIFSIICAQGAVAQESQPRSAEAIIEELIDCLNDAREQDPFEKLIPDQNLSVEEAKRYAHSYARTKTNTTLLNTLNRIKSELSNNNIMEAQRLASSSVPFNDKTADCGALPQDLIRAIDKEVSQRIEDLEGKLSDLETRLSKALINAKEASELDSFIVEIDRLSDDTPRLRNSHDYSNRLRGLNQIVADWQDYLAYLSIGDSKKAKNYLNSISRNVVQTPIVPRSMITERIMALSAPAPATKKQKEKANTPPYTLESVTQQIQSPQDLSQAQEKIQALTQYRDTRNSAQRQLSTITNLQNAIELISSGNPLLGLIALDRVETHNNDDQWAGKIKSEVSQTALFKSIPDSYRPLDTSISLEQSIIKIAQKMKANKNWLTLWEFLKTAAKVHGGRYGNFRMFPGFENDIRAIESFINAQRLEEAGELVSAIDAYKLVLKRTGACGPYQAAQDAIRSIREEKSEALLEEQQRIAKIQKSESEDSKQHYSPFMRKRGFHDERALEKTINRLIDEKLTVHLKNQQKKAAEENSKDKEAK